MPHPALQDFNPPVGVAENLDTGLRRILAPNASPMTYRGTNTYVIGTRGLAVIDPGPDDPAHLQTILDAVHTGQRITHIFVTHAHVDHSPLARDLSYATGAPVLAFGDSASGRSPVMEQLAHDGMAGGGEGVDAAFIPDICLEDCQITTGDETGLGWAFEAIRTPGHFGNHLAFGWNDICFTGDHIMGWASSLVSPPDGDLSDFMASCSRLQLRAWRVFHAGHGAPIDDPAARLDWLINHRNARESDILAALADGPARAYDLATRIYTETPTALMGAATRNVFAHLVDLVGKNRVFAQGALHGEAIFERR